MDSYNGRNCFHRSEENNMIPGKLYFVYYQIADWAFGKKVSASGCADHPGKSSSVSEYLPMNWPVMFIEECHEIGFWKVLYKGKFFWLPVAPVIFFEEAVRKKT